LLDATLRETNSTVQEAILLDWDIPRYTWISVEVYIEELTLTPLGVLPDPLVDVGIGEKGVHLDCGPEAVAWRLESELGKIETMGDSGHLDVEKCAWEVTLPHKITQSVTSFNSQIPKRIYLESKAKSRCRSPVEIKLCLGRHLHAL
jgi:hypothetical protein